MKRFVLLVAVSFCTCSCLADKANGSIISGILNPEKVDYADVQEAVSKNAYAAEISNLLAKMPEVKDKELNSEMEQMKKHLNLYLSTFATYNKNQQRKALANFTKSYKKIQFLRTKNKYPEDDLLNTYLVKLKTNIAHLESGI